MHRALVRLASLVVTLASYVGCLSSSSPAPVAGAADASTPSADGAAAGDAPAAAGGDCTYQIAGGSTASGNCTAFATYDWNGIEDQLEVFVKQDPPPTTSRDFFFLAVLGFGDPTLLKPGTYTASNVQSSDGAWDDGTATWFESSAPALPKGAVFALVISSVSQTTSDAGILFAIHGTVNVTLNGAATSMNGATGTGIVTGTAQF